MKEGQKVTFLDLNRINKGFEKQVIIGLRRIIKTSSFSLGEEVVNFEKKFSSYCNTKHCVGTNNGTSALHLALLSAGVGSGDEVITTPLTFISTCWAISYSGATPVFCDIDPKTFNIDANKIESKITKKTKAIIPVHLFGNPAPMNKILRLAKKHGIKVIEDSAQAHGARYRGKMCGSIGDLGCFSFYPSKNLGAFGEAGAVTTNKDFYVKKLLSLRNHAQIKKNVHQEIGFNYRMEGIQGMILSLKLKRLNIEVKRRQSIAEKYRKNFSSLERIKVQEIEEGSEHSYHLFVLKTNSKEERSGLISYLDKCGIETSIHYPTPIHLQPAYRHLRCNEGSLPVAEDVANTILSIPLYPKMKNSEIDHVLKSVLKWSKNDARN